MTILVVGGCGFIGRHVVNTFAHSGLRVLVYDTISDPINNTNYVNYVKGDFSDLSTLESAIVQYNVSRVIHLVSTTLPKSSNDDMKYDLTSNVVQTLDLLDLCVKHNVNKILYMSSGGTVYGVPKSLPVSEIHPTDPTCSYGICKLTIEKYLALYKHLYGIKYVVLRAANPYGPGQDPLKGQGVIANYVHRMHRGLPLEVWGDGNIVRDYFHVSDLAAFTHRAILSEHCGIFNVGSGNGTSINELIDILSNELNISPEIIYKKQRKLDVPAIVLDCTSAERTFNWRVSFNMQDGIADYVEWYRTEFNKETSC